MSASASITQAPAHPRAALLAVAESMDRLADLVRSLAADRDRAELRIVGREPEELLSLPEAAALLKMHRRSVERLVRGQSCRRRFGRRVLVERKGLMALARRG